MVSIEHVKHLAWLSRLDLSNEELVKYHIEIEKIIEYLDRLDSITLSDVEPRYYKKSVSEFRNDQVLETRTDLSKTTKNIKDGYVKAPKMR
ncbi:MAG TPA: Asp-tRNA(Asn)/Glu-tRNA(Gln) amidotransferase subunit GatC [Nitrososphaeraceae archaeon]|jgi:aspartyl-tRNA(Asn)/glutamyl-tRNA(Gln) amidotransferase subunit C